MRYEITGTFFIIAINQGDTEKNGNNSEKFLTMKGILGSMQDINCTKENKISTNLLMTLMISRNKHRAILKSVKTGTEIQITGNFQGNSKNYNPIYVRDILELTNTYEK